MALQTNYDSDYGFTATAGYVMVSSYRGNKSKVEVDISIFTDQQARIDGKNPIGYVTVDIDMPTTDFMPAIYTHLKTLPEFAGATDV